MCKGYSKLATAGAAVAAVGTMAYLGYQMKDEFMMGMNEDDSQMNFVEPNHYVEKSLIQGKYHEECSNLFDQFKTYFQDGHDTNSQLSIYMGDKHIVDLWGSASDKYDADSYNNIFSSGKSVAAILMAIMVDRGVLDYQERISKYWPAFGQNGKQNILVKDILKHEAGLWAFTKKIDLDCMTTESVKNNCMGKFIEDDSAIWLTMDKQENPDQVNERSYHAMSRAMVMNEIFRRVEPRGRTMSEFMRDEFDLDVYSALNEEEFAGITNLVWPEDFGYANWEKFVAQYGMGEELANEKKRGARNDKPRMIPDTEERKARMSTAEDAFMYKEEYGPKGDPGMSFFTWGSVDNKWVAQGEGQSFNTKASARGLSKIGAYMANRGTHRGDYLISERTWDKFHANSTYVYDFKNNFPSTFTDGGVDENKPWYDEGLYPTPKTDQLYEMNRGFFGWGGFGGSEFRWHPGYKLSFAYVPTVMNPSDGFNVKGRELQAEAIKCAQRIQKAGFDY